MVGRLSGTTSDQDAPASATGSVFGEASVSAATTKPSKGGRSGRVALALPAMSVDPSGRVAMAYLGSTKMPGAPFPHDFSCVVAPDSYDGCVDQLGPDAYKDIT